MDPKQYSRSYFTPELVNTALMCMLPALCKVKKQLLLKALGSLSGSAVCPWRLAQLDIGQLTAQELWLRMYFGSGSVMFILQVFDVLGRLKQINKESCHVHSEEMCQTNSQLLTLLLCWTSASWYWSDAAMAGSCTLGYWLLLQVKVGLH